MMTIERLSNCSFLSPHEQAQGLWMDMHLNRVQPILATHSESCPPPALSPAVRASCVR